MIIPDSIKVDNDEFMNFPYHALVKNFEKKNSIKENDRNLEMQ